MESVDDLLVTPRSRHLDGWAGRDRLELTSLEICSVRGEAAGDGTGGWTTAYLDEARNEGGGGGWGLPD